MGNYGDRRPRVNRSRRCVQNVLFSKRLCTYPPENEAARLYVKFLKDNQYAPEDVEMRIKSEEREENYYGNGGGIENTVEIYQMREESDKEMTARIASEESDVYSFYKSVLESELRLMCYSMGVIATSWDYEDVQKKISETVKEWIGKLKEK